MWDDSVFFSSSQFNFKNVCNFENGPERLAITCNSEHFAFTLRCVHSELSVRTE